MNLIVIGDNVDAMCMAIWTANTNYAVLNKSPSIWTENFKKYVKKTPVIVSTTADQFMSRTVDETVECLKKNEFIPAFVVNSTDDIEYKMYVAVSEYIPSAVTYIRNENNENYNEFIDICRDYLLGKGIICDDNVIRTPKRRKRTSSEG